ncbi:MAG: hypothetical protein ACE5GE_05525 [Phycisphaerae bacterium]
MPAKHEGAVGGTVKRSLAVEVDPATAWLCQTVPPGRGYQPGRIFAGCEEIEHW